MFKKCCSSRSEKNYKIHHSPRPIKLSEEMDTVIKKLLWYTPNNWFIPNQIKIEFKFLIKIYDEFSFTYLMNQMGMNEVVMWSG